MPLTRPIPKTAMPVVRVLRRDVPRPEELPAFHSIPQELGWPRGMGVPACPMGLHPGCPVARPKVGASFSPRPNDRAVNAFGRWWDEQTDAQAAVDAVWPTESEQ